MEPSPSGAFRIFRLAGVDVFLHWTWFLIAVIEVNYRRGSYSSFAWNVAEYLGLFAIVTMHEFGHAMACRSVGGRADRIVLWPLGGVAYVNPPQRPGAVLWSIVAGPLVNLVLLPVFVGIFYWSRSAHLDQTAPDVHAFIRAIMFTNLGLLIFNMLPVYPLDGGQILRALLWYPLGRAWSLMITSVLGFAGVAALVALAFFAQSLWIGIMAFFVGSRCVAGYRQALALSRLAKVPRRAGFACPSCESGPPAGPYWACERGCPPFDLFATSATCPTCSTMLQTTGCVDCGERSEIGKWVPRG